MNSYHYSDEDKARFGKQLGKVVDVLCKGGVYGEWVTLGYVATWAGVREGSTASRIRDMKKWHGWQYEKRRTKIPGVWEYRFTKPDVGQMALL